MMIGFGLILFVDESLIVVCLNQLWDILRPFHDSNQDILYHLSIIYLAIGYNSYIS